MVYNSCMVKHIKIYRAYGTFDNWALVLTNRYIWESPTFKQLHTIWPACFPAYDKHMKCIISFRFVLESRSKVLNGELYAQR